VRCSSHPASFSVTVDQVRQARFTESFVAAGARRSQRPAACVFRKPHGRQCDGSSANLQCQRVRATPHVRPSRASVTLCDISHRYCTHTVKKLTLVGPDTVELQTLTFGAFTRRQTLSRFEFLQPESPQETKQYAAAPRAQKQNCNFKSRYIPFRVAGKSLRFMMDGESEVLDRERLARLFKGQSLL
jgi:hypothetical protein